MTDTTRRLSAEMREKHKALYAAKGEHTIKTMLDLVLFYDDALHDLDVADAEYKEAYQIIFKEMDRYKAEVLRCDKAEKELAAAQATIAQQGAVIAAMREAFVNTPKKWDNGYDGYVCAFCECSTGHTCECPTVREDTAQLAADHDAAVRADERRKVLELVLRGLRSEDDSQQLRAIIASVEAMLAAQPEEAGEKPHREIQIEVAKKLCLELLALKGNSFEINHLAEKIHYALS